MSCRPLLLATLALVTLAGCATARPGSPTVALTARAPLGVRAAGLTPEAHLSVAYHATLTAEGFSRLQRAFTWTTRPESAEVELEQWWVASFSRNYSFDDKQRPTLTLQLSGDAAAWQLSHYSLRLIVPDGGVPINLDTRWVWRDDLKPAAGLIGATRTFFGLLENGGEPLRRQGDVVDRIWRELNGDVLRRLSGGMLTREPYLPSSMKQTQTWATTSADDGTRLILRRHAVRDAQGRPAELFEVEGAPVAPLTTDREYAFAGQLGRVLASAGLTSSDVASPSEDYSAFTAQQLRR